MRLPEIPGWSERTALEQAEILQRLPTRMREIFRARYEQHPPFSLAQLSHAFVVSRERIRQIEAQAVMEIAFALADRHHDIRAVRAIYEREMRRRQQARATHAERASTQGLDRYHEVLTDAPLSNS